MLNVICVFIWCLLKSFLWSCFIILTFFFKPEWHEVHVAAFKAAVCVTKVTTFPPFHPKLLTPTNKTVFMFMFPKDRTDVACLNVLFSWCYFYDEPERWYIWNRWNMTFKYLMLIVFKCQSQKKIRQKIVVFLHTNINVTFEAMFNVIGRYF